MDFLTKKLPDFHGTVYFYLYGARGRTRTGTVSLPVDFEFSGQSRTCYPLVEPTGLLGHLLRGQKPLKY